MQFEFVHWFDADFATLVRGMYDDRLPAWYEKEMQTIISITPEKVDRAGTKIRRVSKYLPQPLIRKIGTVTVEPEWMAWREESELDTNARRGTFRNIPQVGRIAALMDNHGTLEFSEQGGRTKRVIRGELKIKVFLVGKIAEKIIHTQAARILDDEARAFNAFLKTR